MIFSNHNYKNKAKHEVYPPAKNSYSNVVVPHGNVSRSGCRMKNHSIKIDNISFESVEGFKYMGTT